MRCIHDMVRFLSKDLTSISSSFLICRNRILILKLLQSSGGRRVTQFTIITKESNKHYTQYVFLPDPGSTHQSHIHPIWLHLCLHNKAESGNRRNLLICHSPCETILSA